MPKPSAAFNPFYALLLVAGVVFAITACAYGVMAARFVEPAAASTPSSSGQGLLNFLDRHGFTLLLVELLVLAAATFAAIGTDEYWTRRAASRSRQSDEQA
jgi:hypothetical protein